MKKIKRSRSASRRGSALMIALAILVLISVLALTFVLISGRAREEAKRSVDKTSAQNLARSGIEVVKQKQVSPAFFEYAGEDWDNDGQDTVLKQHNDELETYNGDGDDKLETFVSPKYALRPSLYARQEDSDKPKLIPVTSSGETKYRGFTRRDVSTFEGGYNTYTLRIRDNNTKLNLNSLNPNFSKIVSRLYTILSQEQELVGPGSKIVKNRPEPVQRASDHTIEGGYESPGRLKDVLTSEKYNVLEPYIAVPQNLWVDSTVIQPKPQPEASAGTAESPTDPSSAFPYNFDYDLQPRAPINVNQAPEPLLQALIWGLKGRALAVSSVSNETEGKAIHRTVNVGPITRKEAQKIARQIVLYRKEERSIKPTGLLKKTAGQSMTGPIRTWNEFAAFVRQKLIKTNIISRAKGHLLLANFHPNTHFSKFNYNENGQWSWTQDIQDQSYRLFLDKTDLLYYTTEFSLTSMGFLEVQSYGRITDGDGKIQAQSTIEAIIRKYKVAKHTTQNDFLVNSVKKGMAGENHPSTKKVSILPESKANAGTLNILQNNGTGGDYGGQITVGHPSELGIGHLQLPFSDSPSETMSKTLPHGHQIHGYSDTAPKNKEQRKGLLGGKHLVHKNSGNTSAIQEQYPKKDPANYSDISAEGALIGSDRNHTIRFPTHDWDGEDQKWKEGHLEFWWKPKQPIQLKDTHELTSVNWYKETIHQYRTEGSRMTLFDMWVLAESAEVTVPEYLNTKYQPAWIGNQSDQFLWFMPQGGVVEFRDYQLPNDIKERKGIEPNTTNGAGVYFELWLQDNTWYFLVRFRSIFRPEEKRWISPKHEDLNLSDNDMLGGAVLATLPAEGEAKPKPGQWNHIVLSWEPQKATEIDKYQKHLNYQTPDRFIQYPESMGAVPFYHAIPRPPAQRQENKRILDGNFWINGEKFERKTVWGEGNFQKEFLFVSNLGTAKYGAKKYVGTMPAGWPPSVYPLQDGSVAWAPTMIGPKRLQNMASVGHLGGKIRRRGPMFDGVGDGEDGSGNDNGNDSNGENGSSNQLVPYEDGKQDAKWWHSFAEGTIDEAYLSSSAEQAEKAIKKRDSRYYHSNPVQPGSSPAYVGRIRRRKSSFWSNSGAGRNYLKRHYPMFEAEEESEINIQKIGFTQFPPRRNWDGKKLDNAGQPIPHFQLQMQKPGQNSFLSPESTWLGTFLPPDEIFPGDIEMEGSQQGLSYRFLLKNAGKNEWDSLNITPYLEGLTVFYKPEGMTEILEQNFIQPE